MNATEVKTDWPKLRVRYASGKSGEIFTMEKAADRFGLDQRTVNWFRSGGLAGTQPRTNGKGIDMLELYTQQDAMRDAAGDLLAALEGIMDHGLVPRESVAGRIALAAIKKAHCD